MTYQIFAEIRPRKMLNSESQELNKHGGDIHTGWKTFLPPIFFKIRMEKTFMDWEKGQPNDLMSMVLIFIVHIN